MRKLLVLISLMILFLAYRSPLNSQASHQEIALIIQVEENPYEITEEIKRQYPKVRIIEVFDLLFSGIALKIQGKDLKDFMQAPFIKNYYPVRNYEAINSLPMDMHINPFEAIPVTPYTGKGIKIGVIDTGIDYTHPDLKDHYKGGYDLIDLDDDPMETLPEEGLATSHGTHVSGIIKELAPQAELYAYRALGPAGQGTSIQVIAALEKAVTDGMDILNLSLGNSINGPDFPTTLAVNKAVDLGLAVVIANGNDGPAEWTVGSPATSHQALSVGAAEKPKKLAYLLDDLEGKSIPLHPLTNPLAKNLYKDYEIINYSEDMEDIKGKIVLLGKKKQNITEQIKIIMEKEAFALLLDEELGEELGEIGSQPDLPLPVYLLASKDFTWLENKAAGRPYFLPLRFKKKPLSVPNFSSKGPVTGSWRIKPDLVAPGTNIKSTIPGGYASYSGTSMAAPYVTGAIALLKEAKPTWTSEQIVQAIKTSASPLLDESGEKLPGTAQGMGFLDIQKALQTPIIIDSPLLSFGRLTNYKEEKNLLINLQNVSKSKQDINFFIPKKKRGISWNLPLSFSLLPGETKEIPLQVGITSLFLEEGLHQGWLDLFAGKEKYSLPYLFMNQKDNYPKLMGFSLGANPFEREVFDFQFYTPEALQSFQVDLLELDTLIFKERLLQIKDIPKGLYKGQITKNLSHLEGSYLAIFTILGENQQIETYEERLTF